MANKTARIKQGSKFRGTNQAAGVKKRLGKAPLKKVGVADARQKIIQKKRKTVIDARDILSNLAKRHDARSKLLKIREKTDGNVRPIGANILRKTDRNGKISLVTNKHRPSNNMNMKIQQQLGLLTSQRASSSRNSKRISVKRPVKADFEPPAIRKTIRNEYSSPMPPPYLYQHPDMYRWYSGVSPMLAPLEMRRPIMDISVSRDIVSDNSSGEWKTFSAKMRPNGGYIDLDAVHDDEDMPLMSTARPGMGRISSNVHSRLDAKVQPNSSHGILSKSKPPNIRLPMGHRIVVSNLQPTVTHDDIRELFEDIGKLLVSRLVRPGTAEVIYQNLKDAQKAVDTYHNRQLDGQPMKCLLVNKRPLNNPTAPAIKNGSDGILSRKLPTVTQSSSTKLIPDISTIHKVLFQRN